MKSVLFLTVVLFSEFLFVNGIGCRDQYNKGVDWFYGYKMPRTDDNSLPGVGDGVAFYYLDANSDSFTPSPNDMTSKDQKFGLTNKSVDSTRVEYGHTKGVLFFDKTGGFWLIHSVPKFPPTDSYSYPDSGTIYAQSILCLSFDYSQLRRIGTQLYFNHPSIYKSQIPTSFASDNPDLASVIGGQYKKGVPYSSTVVLTTSGGQDFTSFAKSADFNQDLYASLVAPSLQAPLNVETWRRGSAVPLNCTAKYPVLDAQEMKVGSTAEFKYTHDHSKIAVSSSTTKPYVCVGDINRMKSQFVRGGGTVCLNSNKVWKAYSSLNNKDVDWFYGYKVPKINDNSLPGVGDGVAFYYLDANSDSFTPSPNDMNSKDQAIAYTLQQYYDNQNGNDYAYVMYNDEKALSDEFFEELSLTNKSIDSTRVEYGHTKGVVFFDKTAGFWLIHSVPKFPPTNSYMYTSNGMPNAQSFLCLSFEYSQLRRIGTQLYFNHPPIYKSQIPTSFASDNPDLASVIGGKHKTGVPYSSTVILTTVGGQDFTSFAKSADFNQDLYANLVAPSLQAPLNVETWRTGKEVPLNCSARYIVLDAQEMKVGSTTEFRYTRDHAKIAVSTSSTKPYVCIGDINRMTSQFTRGGGAVCLNSNKVWKAYSPLIVSTNSC
ncbi:hypothetical protein FO519_002905 [Halicephalobus sp. NKZ332]|nr:hypothetical protein FO519_002905 [Halicephalobus sp. NKZ332]